MSDAQIVSDPNILAGKPVIGGTRISVELVLEEIGAGSSIDDILRAYPHLTREQLLAAVRFASQVIRNDAVYPFQAQTA